MPIDIDTKEIITTIGAGEKIDCELPDPTDVSFNAEGKKIAVSLRADEFNYIEIVDIETGAHRTISYDDPRVASEDIRMPGLGSSWVSFHPTEKNTLAIFNKDTGVNNPIIILDLDTGKWVNVDIPEHIDCTDVQGIDFHPDGVDALG